MTEYEETPGGDDSAPSGGRVTISPELARAEFDRFVNLWEIDGDTDTMDDESREGFEDHRRKICKAIERGALTLTDNGGVCISLRHTTLIELTSVTLHVPTGAAYTTWDNYKERQNVHKLNAMLGSMAKLPPATFSKVDARDLKLVMAVATLFLGS